MPGREIPLINGQFYHVLNRGINSQKIFNCDRDYWQFIERVKYYRNNNLPLRYAHFSDLSLEVKNDLLNQLNGNGDFMASIVAYCLMPNHFHIVVKQLVDDGVKNYLRLVSDSFAHYFNIKNDRGGPLFESRFKAVRIEKDAQLLHVVRYIHLNPYSSYLVKNLEDLGQYPFSSFPEYIGKAKKEICQKRLVLDHFKIYGKYKEFVFNQADYQKSLAKIKHSLMD